MAHSSSSISGSSDNRSLNILIVEAEEDVAFLADILAKQKGYRVRSASSLESALCAAGEDKIDVLISDLDLPDGSGRTLRDRLSSQSRDVFFSISVSNYRSEKDIERSVEAGFDAHVTRPLDPHELASLVERMCPGVNR